MRNGPRVQPSRATKPKLTVEERFWAKVDASGDCWEWTAKLDGTGYGRFALTKQKNVAAHRFAYELLVGPIPEGLQLDHLCRHRKCLNPDHLEPVTAKVNMRRAGAGKRQLAQTHCKHGHPLSGDNLYRYPPTPRHPTGQRQCRTCRREGLRRFHERRAAVAALERAA